MKRVSPEVDGDFERLFIDHPLYHLTPQSFSLEIERAVKDQNMTYLEAVAHLCEKYEIDYTAVPKLLTDTMKDKIEMDAEARHMFRKHAAPAPATDFFRDVE